MANVFLKDFTPTVIFLNPTKPSFSECMEYFSQFLRSFSFFQHSDLEKLENYWEYAVIPKNKSIVLPGEVCEHLVFICKGAVKHFTGGPESQYIIEFVSEGNFSCGLSSFKDRIRSMDGFVCTRNTYGLKISYEKFQQIIKSRPAFEQLFNHFSKISASNVANRLASFQSMDAKGRYELMMNRHPDVFEKFTMQDISNYLGIKAETLSRLKRGMNK